MFILQRKGRTRRSLEEQRTYAVGHLALGYLSGKATSKLLKVNVNVPLLFLASTLPDIDFLIPVLKHRGPTHSIIILFLLFLPAFILLGKKATPYFSALIQHILIGDYLTGRIQLFWPVATNWYSLGVHSIPITSFANIFLEWILFLTSITIMFKTKDARLLFEHHPSNLILSIPVLTVLLPAFLSFPLSVPLELIIPHLTYLTLFTLSILTDFKAILTRNSKR